MATDHQISSAPSAPARPALARWSRSGTAQVLLVAAWSAAEATVWPIMPDAVVVPLAYRSPRRWWRFVLAAAGGTALGGALSYRAGRRRGGRGPAWRAPLVRPRMVTAVRRWLEMEGGRGVWRQPASGIPVKVFAHEAGAMGIPFPPFLARAVVARTARFVLAAGGAALTQRLLPGAVTRRPWLLLVIWSAVFGVGLWRTVVAWSDPSELRHAATSLFTR